MTSTLLHTCARATTFPELSKQLVDHCAGITDWDGLLIQAEQQGLGPLLHWHLHDLGDVIPVQARRATRLLFLRHHQTNTVYAEVLREILEALDKAGIDVLVLKGAALCHTIYPEIGLRPMRDIDMLIRKKQCRQAQDLLITMGFTESTAPRPTDHFHLPSLHKQVQHISVCIELHHGLFPDCPPYYRKVDFDVLYKRAIKIDLEGITAYCPGYEDMLWHIFEHGLHMPLTYEPFKLIAVADIITLVEMRGEEIDWDSLQTASPNILAALPFLHHLTPWQEQVLTKFSWQTHLIPNGVGEIFQGWPHLRLSEQKDTGFFTILRNTFLPPEWWCRMYYGIKGKWNWYACRCWNHPRHVFWWMRLYSDYLVEKNENADSTTSGEGGKSKFLKFKQFQNKLSALLRKFQ